MCRHCKFVRACVCCVHVVDVDVMWWRALGGSSSDSGDGALEAKPSVGTPVATIKRTGASSPAAAAPSIKQEAAAAGDAAMGPAPASFVDSTTFVASPAPLSVTVHTVAVQAAPAHAAEDGDQVVAIPSESPCRITRLALLSFFQALL